MGFKYGEIVLAICIRSKKGTRSLPKKSRCLFKLERGGMARGAVAHDDLVSRGLEHAEVNGVVFRRPTLDEYVVMMKRVPTPTYPDDARAMAAILDLNEGSKVLEAGSGSGGLSLYLSKNVGASGQVYSFESNPHHMHAARSNYSQWRVNWALTRTSLWPDNVLFLEQSVTDAGKYMTSEVDAVALDLVDPGPLLCHMIPILKPGGLLSVYLPNISQYLDLLGHLHSQGLPLQLERVVELISRDWTIKPAASKHPRLADQAGREEGEGGRERYICRPSHVQRPHTAFLGLLRRLGT